MTKAIFPLFLSRFLLLSPFEKGETKCPLPCCNACYRQRNKYATEYMRVEFAQNLRYLKQQNSRRSNRIERSAAAALKWPKIGNWSPERNDRPTLWPQRRQRRRFVRSKVKEVPIGTKREINWTEAAEGFRPRFRLTNGLPISHSVTRRANVGL